MSDPIKNEYIPDHDMVRNPGQRVSGTGFREKVVPKLMVVYRCPNPSHLGVMELDAYQGPPRCNLDSEWLVPVGLGAEHVAANQRERNAHPSAKGRPHT